MSHPITIPPGFDGLPVREKVEFVQKLWRRIGEEQQSVPSPEWHRDEVLARLEAHRRNPEAARPWPEVREELEERFGRKR